VSGGKDPCCIVCRGKAGKCLTDFTCDHHRRFIDEEPTHATHRDPTAEQALRNIDREEQERRNRPR
jgi:hypothetical protein